jgi:hypothetical protein
MNKNGEKVNKAQLRENERCLRAFQRGRLVEATFNICTTADDKGRVQKAMDRTEGGEEKKCDTLTVPPPFAYTDADTVNTAAMNVALELTYTIFGGPSVLDDNLVTKDENVQTAKCQVEMLMWGDKLENTVLKELNKEKKKAIKDEAVGSAAALEARLQTVFSNNRRINTRQDRLVKSVDRQCAVLQVPPATIFPGECSAGDRNLREIEVCVIDAARCDACLKINAFDDLDLDCDQADDQIANGSCSSLR